jgi:3-hydroxybutyryl-CoA dehydrogenase
VAARATHRERILGAHFWLPPYLVPLVEVVRTAETAPECVDTVFGLLQRAGKHPVRVQKDVAGFVGNRVQHALWREAFAIIDEGICDPATVDEVIRNGFGLRLAALDPLENADMIGLDLTLAIHDDVLKPLNADPHPSTTLRAKVARGELGFKSGTGFLPWNAAAIADSRDRVTAHLMRALRAGQGSENQKRPGR